MSEKTLEKLISTLKSEAIEAAELKAQEILDQAEAQAGKIVKKAQEKRTNLLNNAQKEAQETLTKGESALKQAARDISVSVRNDILKLLKAALERDVKNSFAPDLMIKVIMKLVENVGSGVTLKLPENMEINLAKKIQNQMQNSTNLDSITTDATLLRGFTITKTDQGWSYYISPEEVTELLNVHLSPHWVKLLKTESDE